MPESQEHNRANPKLANFCFFTSHLPCLKFCFASRHRSLSYSSRLSYMWDRSSESPDYEETMPCRTACIYAV